ncbi:hypothetical protein FQA39_LY07401 [Lamprigera yunnana]|nr:hypothetical protein FQA39_LY07401 [Lamprigera yunnana]
MRKIFKSCNKGYLYQCLATITGSFSALSIGINSAWTSPYLPQILNGAYPDIQMTSDEGSWCAVMPPLAAPIGAFLAAQLVDRIGRKATTLLVAPFTFAMFLALAFTTNFYLICAIRFGIGVVETVLYTSLPMYLGEIAAPSIRGILTSSVGFAFLIGTLIINVLGIYVDIFISSLICALVPLLHFLTYVLMPESPYYYIKKNNEEEAKKSLIKFRGTPDVDDELKTLTEMIRKQEKEEQSSVLNLFTVKTNRLGLCIFFILNVTRKFSGSSPFLFYTGMIFKEAGGSIDANLSVIIFLCVQIASAMVSLTIIDRIGRRPVIISSTIICTLALAVSGLYFYFKRDSQFCIEHLGWLPLTVLTGYMIFYNLGLELSPMVYASELFPTNVKAAALGVVDSISALNGIVTIKLFQILTDSHGMHLPFWVFSGCCGITLILIIKYVPETKNKSLEEIQLDLLRLSGSKPRE